jgi:hypothetical protein
MFKTIRVSSSKERDCMRIILLWLGKTNRKSGLFCSWFLNRKIPGKSAGHFTDEKQRECHKTQAVYN